MLNANPLRRAQKPIHCLDSQSAPLNVPSLSIHAQTATTDVVGQVSIPVFLRVAVSIFNCHTQTLLNGATIQLFAPFRDVGCKSKLSSVFQSCINGKPLLQTCASCTQAYLQSGSSDIFTFL